MERKYVFLAFAAALREGVPYSDTPASGEKITRTLRYCGQILESRGFADPRKSHPGQHALDHEFTDFVRLCKDADPPVCRQQAVPASLIAHIADTAPHAIDTRTYVTGLLVVLAFFFLLRVGEYTKQGSRRTRTVPLRKSDVTLWRNGHRVDPEAPLDTLLAADSTTICLENQKNGYRGCILHHHASGHRRFCPVEASARLLYRLHGLPPATPLGSFQDDKGLQQVTADNVRTMLRQTAARQGLESQGFDLTRIGTHSLRSGGAMALRLAGYADATIKNLGRWSSNTYLLYIQTQIAQLSHGVATSMARRLHFHNVG